MKKALHLFAIAALLLFVIVSCNKGAHIESIKLDQEELILPVGGTATLKATILPLNAADITIIWKSSNTSVATVSVENALKSLVTGKGGGEATITATTKDGKLVARCIVDVVTPDPEMITVEGGTFTMGNTDSLSSAFPAHQVTLKGFKIGKYIVTEKLWHIVMGGAINPKSKDFPMMFVSWYKAQEFIQKLNEFTGKKFRLPTEAEWEFAARGGKKSQGKGFIYSGSNNINEVAWYSGNSDNTPHPVGLKKPNELGIYDMSGNMWEWCYDWWGEYTDEPQTNPTGPSTGSYRIIRGGGFAVPAVYNSITFRNAYDPSNTQSYIGLRLAHD